MSRGLRNCNPGNIRISGVTYKGEVVGADPAFKQFESMEWGYRAMFVLLHTYRVRYGLDTIELMIRRWAPPVENDTDIYVAAVSRISRMDAMTSIDTLQREAMVPIVAAMSRVECGVAADMAAVELGWKLFAEEYV